MCLCCCNLVMALLIIRKRRVLLRFQGSVMYILSMYSGVASILVFGNRTNFMDPCKQGYLKFILAALSFCFYERLFVFFFPKFNIFSPEICNVLDMRY